MVAAIPTAQHQPSVTTMPPTFHRTSSASTPPSEPASVAFPVEPQWATPVAEVPSGPSWVHEVELVGTRLLASVAPFGSALGSSALGSRALGSSTLVGARAGALEVALFRCDPGSVPQPWAEPAPWLVAALGSSAFAGCVLDGMVCTPPGASEPLFFGLDLPFVGGRDLRGASLIERKRALRDLLAHLDVGREAGRSRLRLCDHVLGAGAKVFDRACELGVEGVISKRVDSIYEGGRSPAWLEVKCARRLGLVVGGFTAPHGSRRHFGALLLGSYDASGKLQYRGKVGSGFGEDVLARLRPQLDLLRQDAPAFANPPVGSQARGVSWVRPELGVEVEFGELTERGRLRHARFKGLGPTHSPARAATTAAPPIPTTKNTSPIPRGRPPLTRVPSPTRLRTPTASAPTSSPVPLSDDLSDDPGTDRATPHLALVDLSDGDRCVVPGLGLCKRDLADYVMQVAEPMLAHLRGRALALRSRPEVGDLDTSGDAEPSSRVRTAVRVGLAEQVRLPEGVEWASASQPPMATSDRAQAGFARAPEPGPRAVSVNDGLGLVGLIELDVVEIRTHAARLDKPEFPDRLGFTLLGEGGAEFERLLAAADDLRERLAKLGLVAFLKTSGRSDAVDLVVPVQRRRSFAAVARFCQVFAHLTVDAAPHRYTLARAAEQRRGKVAIRHQLNHRHATMLAPYSLRAAGGPTDGRVSTPLGWDELGRGVRPEEFDPASVTARLASLGEDPWTDFFTLRQWITKAAFRRLGIDPDLRGASVPAPDRRESGRATPRDGWRRPPT